MNFYDQDDSVPEFTCNSFSFMYAFILHSDASAYALLILQEADILSLGRAESSKSVRSQMRDGTASRSTHTAHTVKSDAQVEQ